MTAPSAAGQSGRRRRLAIGAIAATLSITVIALVCLPLFISKERLREALEARLETVTGHQVTLSGPIDLSLVPVPSLSVSGVEIISSRSDAERPLMRAGRIEADFGLIAALVARPQFTELMLDEPHFSIEFFGDGTTSWMSRKGDIADTTAIAAENARAADAPDDSGEAPRPLPLTSIGEIGITDGMLTVIDRPHATEETLTSLNGQFNWPRVGMGARLDIAGVLRGEPVRIVATAERPADLLAGSPAPFDIAFEAEPLVLTYDGTASFSQTPTLNGAIELTSPSARRALRWSGAEIKAGEAIGALSIASGVTAEAGSISLHDLAIDIDGYRGVGALDLSWPSQGVPVLSGTLAYETLDVGSFLEAFTPLPGEGDDVASTIDTTFLRELGLDLRFSAQEARIGSLRLQGLGAAARIEAGRAVFDVGDARAFGGNVSGRIAIAEDGFKGGGEVQLSAQDVDFAAMIDTFGIAGPLPRGIGSMTMSLTSPNPVWATSLGSLQGSVDLMMRDGTIPDFDLDAFRALSDDERFFEISRVSGAPLPFERARFVASFANGTAELQTGEILTAMNAIILSGLIPYESGSLAMSGAITPRAEPAEEQNDPIALLQRTLQNQETLSEVPLRFFIGGSWPSPVISPIRQD